MYTDDADFPHPLFVHNTDFSIMFLRKSAGLRFAIDFMSIMIRLVFFPKTQTTEVGISLLLINIKK